MTRNVFAATSLALICALSACGKSEKAQSKAENDPWKLAEEQAGPVPMGPLTREVVPLHYRLDLTIDPTHDRFSGHDEIDVKFVAPKRAIYLDGLDLHVARVVAKLASGKTIVGRFAQVHSSGIARLLFQSPVPVGQATLIFDYDAPFGQSLSGLYKVKDNGDSYAFTQFESTDARRAFPSFDEPGFKTSFAITVNAPIDDKVIANTPIVYDSSAGNGMMRTVFQPTNPLPTYLVAMAVGPLDIVDGGDIDPNPNAHRTAPIHLRGITARGKGDQIKYALTFTPKIILNLENYFGIAYPFQKLDLLAVPDFAAGAMENAGAVTFREHYLLLNEASPLDQKRGSVAVQAHELTHQWFGDLVTPHWWDDTWLNESFADWMAVKASTAVEPAWSFDRGTLDESVSVMRLDELPSAREIHQPVNGPDDIENSFDSITYNKGAAVLAMFESYLGPDLFNRGIHAYLTKFASGNATAQDFVQTIAQTTNHPEIVDSFNNFINQPGIPYLQTKLQCQTGSASLGVAQSMYVPFGRTAPQRAWNVPMCLSSANTQRDCQIINAGSATVSLGQTCPAYVEPNAQGTGYYRYAMDEPGWAALIKAAPQLSPADQLTIYSNVDAALHAGQASAADLIQLIAALAPGAQWDLLQAIRDSLHRLRTSVLENEDLTPYHAFIARHFAARLAAIGYAEPPNEAPTTTLARPILATILVEEARDPATITALANLATNDLMQGNKSGLAPDLVREAFRAGVISGQPGFDDKLIAGFNASREEYTRSAMIYGIAGSGNTTFLSSFLALTSQVRTGELRYVLSNFSQEPTARAALWSWFEGNYAEFIKRVSPLGMLGAPSMLSSSCSAGERKDLEAFFRPKVSQLPGTQRTLALAEQQIDRCLAFKDAKGAEVEAAFRAAK
jgi:cytosol alanyl aminopeptidase